MELRRADGPKRSIGQLAFTPGGDTVSDIVRDVESRKEARGLRLCGFDGHRKQR